MRTALVLRELRALSADLTVQTLLPDAVNG